MISVEQRAALCGVLITLCAYCDATFAQEPRGKEALYAVGLTENVPREQMAPQTPPGSLTLYRLITRSGEDWSRKESLEAVEIWGETVRFFYDMQVAPDQSMVAVLGKFGEAENEREGVLLIPSTRPSTLRFVSLEMDRARLGFLRRDDVYRPVVYEIEMKTLVSVDTTSLVIEKEPQSVARDVIQDAQSASFRNTGLRVGFRGQEIYRPYPVPDWLKSKFVGNYGPYGGMYETENYSVIVLVGRSTAGPHEREICIFDKQKKSWSRHTIKGSATSGKTVLGQIVFSIGWDYPDANRLGRFSTGEWFLLRGVSGKMEKFVISSWPISADTDVLYWKHGEAILYRDRDKYTFVPYQDTANWRESARSFELENEDQELRAVFWGAVE